MTNSDLAPASLLFSAFLRSIAFFGFWLVLTDAQAADVPAGVVAAIAATWASLRLMPQQQWNVRPAKLAETRVALFLSVDHRRNRCRPTRARSTTVIATRLRDLSSNSITRNEV